VVERAVVLSRRRQIDVDDLPEHLLEQINSPGAADGVYRPLSLKTALEEPRNASSSRLRANNWNRQLTASILEINRTTLYKKMKRLQLENDPLAAGDGSAHDSESMGLRGHSWFLLRGLAMRGSHQRQENPIRPPISTAPAAPATQDRGRGDAGTRERASNAPENLRAVRRLCVIVVQRAQERTRLRRLWVSQRAANSSKRNLIQGRTTVF